MKKKLLTLMLALLLCLLPLASCSLSTNPTDIYTDALNGLMGAKGITAKISLNISATTGESMKEEINIKTNGESLQLRCAQSHGKNIHELIYTLADGKESGSIDGVKLTGNTIKREMSSAFSNDAGITLLDASSMQAFLIPTLLPEQLSGAQLTIKSDGTYIYEIANLGTFMAGNLLGLNKVVGTVAPTNATAILTFAANRQFSIFETTFDLAMDDINVISVSYKIEYLAILAGTENNGNGNGNGTTDDESTDDTTTDPNTPDGPDDPDDPDTTPLTAWNLYSEAIAKLNAATAMEVKQSQTTTLSYSGMPIEMTMINSGKLNQNNITTRLETLSNMASPSSEEVVYIDEYMYDIATTSGEPAFKQKGALSLETLKQCHEAQGRSFEAPIDLLLGCADIPELVEADLKDVTVTTNNDGTYSFTIHPSIQQMSTLSVLKGSLQMLGAETLTTTASSLVFVFNADRTLASFNLDFEGEAADGISAEIEYSFEVSNLNGNVTITPPADADTYTEIDMEAYYRDIYMPQD